MLGIKSRFRPHWFLTCLVVGLVSGFIYLGLWQLERAEQKRQLAAQLTLRQQQPPLAGTELEHLDSEDMEHRYVQLDGWFLESQTLLIENRKWRGKNGFHVITPLRLVDSDRLLAVNRGWVPAPFQAISTASELVRLSGKLVIPADPVLDLSGDTEIFGTVEDAFPRWPFLTVARYQRWTQAEAYPMLMLLSPDSEGGFARDWPSPRVDPGMHIGYALQWFAFALIVVGIWGRLSFSKSGAVLSPTGAKH